MNKFLFFESHIYFFGSIALKSTLNMIMKLCIRISIPLLCLFRKLRERDASKFHAQLCIVMLLMLLVFVVGIRSTENEIACTLVSTMIQYFTLAAAFWMGAEAVLMYKKLIIVFGKTTVLFIALVSAISWGMYVLFQT